MSIARFALLDERRPVGAHASSRGHRFETRLASAGEFDLGSSFIRPTPEEPMTKRALALVLSAVVALSVVAIGASTAPAAATGIHCKSVHAGRYSATHVFVDFMRCKSARGKLHTWLASGHLPRHTNGWYCRRLSGVIRECSFPGKSNPSKDFTFWLRKKKH
jgi:predicted anti-sigma-YlaC factor YlaD